MVAVTVLTVLEEFVHRHYLDSARQNPQCAELL